MNRRQALTGLAAAAVGTVLATPGSTQAHGGDDRFPTLIPLPDNFNPEGIAIGDRPVAYFGSLANGSIYRASLVTGQGALLPAAAPGTPSVGLKIDDRGRLFVAGGPAGNGRVVSARDGSVLAAYTFQTAPTFVNDVVRDAARGLLHRLAEAVLVRAQAGPPRLAARRLHGAAA